MMSGNRWLQGSHDGGLHHGHLSCDRKVLKRDELLRCLDQKGLNRYRSGDTWGKQEVVRSQLETDPVYRKTVMGTARFVAEMSFYLGKFAGEHLMATNDHVCCPKAQCCCVDIVFEHFLIEVEMATNGNSTHHSNLSDEDRKTVAEIVGFRPNRGVSGRRQKAEPP